MKKILILFSLMLIVFPSIAQTNSIDSLADKLKPELNINIDSNAVESLKGIVPDSAMPMYREVYSDLKAASRSMASGLGVAVKELFNIVVDQQMVYSITNIVFFCFSLIFGIWCVRAYKKSAWGDSDSKTPFNISALVSLFTGALCIVFMIWTFCTVNTTITGLVNPKYNAIKEIVDMASDIKNGKAK